MNRKKKRREFLKKLTAFSILIYNSGLIQAKSTLLPLTQTSGSKKIKIGIIGAENSHTIAFGKMFNIDKSFPGVSVVSVWGETKELAQKAMKEGNIPKAVEHPEDMLGTIDALIVAHRHAKYHLDAALPFIKAGIPTFIDKPFCYRVKNGLFATLIFRSLSRGWTTFAETEKGILEIKSDATEPSPKIAYSDMVEMFRSGKEPRSHDNIIKCVATLEALEKSSKTEKWEFIEI